MAANINDKFSEVSTGVRPTTTTVASVRSVSGSSLVCDDLTGWATNTAVHFVTYELDGQGSVVAGTQQDMKGIVSGNTISNIIVTGGTDIGNKVGDIVQQLPTAAYAKDLAEGIKVSHDDDGTISAGVVGSTQLANSAVGSTQLANSAVTTSKMQNSSVTPEKIAYGPYVVVHVFNDATGSQNITGIPFKPRAIVTTSCWSGLSAYSQLSQGAASNNSGTTVQKCSSTYVSSSAWRSETANEAFYNMSAGGGSTFRAQVTSWNNDGVTINVGATNSANGARTWTIVFYP